MSDDAPAAPNADGRDASVVTTDTVVAVSPDVLWQEVQGEVILLDLGQGQYFSLDPVGCRMWKLLLGGITVGEAVEQLREVFEVDADRLRADLLELVATLHDRQLVTVSS